MTVATTTSKIVYTGNGVTTLYAFPYPFIAASDLQVYVAGVLKTLTTDYSISGSAPYPAGANVTFVSAPANGAAIVIQRIRPYTQTLDLVANDPLPADSTELEFDHVVMLTQQLNEALSRALVIPTTDVTGTSVTIPAAASRANMTLGFDASGNVTVGAVTTGTLISAAMIPVVQAATLALARVAFGLGSNFTTEGTITAAATTDLGSLSSQEIVITGNTGITGFGNTASLAAPLYLIRFTGTPLLTNSATLILPGAANYQVVAGDMAIAKFEGSSTWRIVLMPSSGRSVVPGVVTVKRQVFNSSGTYTPSAGMLYCDPWGIGGGGGGGGVAASSGNTGGGGAAGSETRKLVSAATIGASQVVTIGAGGTAGASGGGTGGTGGTTSLGAIISCPGGLGGTQGNLDHGALGGLGQIATGGDVNGTGAPGQNAQGTGNSNYGNSGNGGSSSIGGGALGLVGFNGAAAGNAGAANTGGGGSGGYAAAGTAEAGGAGGSGRLVITEWCSQ